MKSIFTILAVLLFSLPLRAADNKGSLEFDQNNGDSQVGRPGYFYSSWQEFSHVASNSLLYLGTGGMAAGALLSYTSERYAKPFIFGSLACLAGGVFFKALGRTVSSVWGINRSQLDKHQNPPINPLPGGSVTAEIQAGGGDVELANAANLGLSVSDLDVVRAPIVETSAERHSLLSSVKASARDANQNQIDDDNHSDHSADWTEVEEPEISTSKGVGYIGNAIKYLTNALSFPLWARKKNTD